MLVPGFDLTRAGASGGLGFAISAEHVRFVALPLFENDRRERRRRLGMRKFLSSGSESVAWSVAALPFLDSVNLTE